MNILFLTISNIANIEDRGIYTDLLRCFCKNGHNVYTVSPYERRLNEKTTLYKNNNAHMLHVKIGNITKCNIVEKGISTMLVEAQFLAAIKKYFNDVKFDLIIYSTPPVTFAKVISYIKKRDNAKSYLMLKDIFPQNAVDLGMIKTTGLKGLIYKYFRNKEKKLYELSDRIGCMSQANVDYVLQHNPEISQGKVEECPNCIDICNMDLSEEERLDMRDKYGIPNDKKVFIYGGNLGKPQTVPFIIKCLKKCETLTDTYFIIAGSGTDRHLIEKYLEEEKPSHVKLFGHIPKDEYDRMIACCDVGLIFLDHRFTIPNFPSRLLAYMQAGLPVLACTDRNTDIGNVLTGNNLGWWCESKDENDFLSCVIEILKKPINNKKIIHNYLAENYSAKRGYEIINSFYHRK